MVMLKVDPKFGVGFGWVNSMAATEAVKFMAGPLLTLKNEVERLLAGFKPAEEVHVVESLDLTWKGGLWRMSLEAALGVQYLHHHRYWSDGGKRHNGATNQVEEEQEGWKVRASGRSECKRGLHGERERAQERVELRAPQTNSLASARGG